MAEGIRWKSKPLETWGKLKEYRMNYFRNYAEAHQKGGLRCAGGAAGLPALFRGLGDDVYYLSSEGYGASVGNDPQFSMKCMEACEAQGFARDLCAYLRNYWGSVFLNKYLFGGEFPLPDFAIQTHVCCSHAKWYQVLAEKEGFPFFCIDMSRGLSEESTQNPQRVEYVVQQCLDAIEWMEKVTGRKYDDEKLIKAVYTETKNMTLWSEICFLNKAIPAPLDEKSMYTMYVLLVLDRASQEATKIYEELKAEVEDRVRNQVAAVPTERFRIMHDGQPPWSFLKIFRTLEQYGVVSVGSFYTFGLMAGWDFVDGHLVPPVPLEKQGMVLKNREDALRALIKWHSNYWRMTDQMCEAQPKVKYLLSIAQDWHAQAALVHYNRGCEGISLQVAEGRLGLVQAGLPVLVYEGNMADDREFDDAATMARVEAFMESLELKRIKQ